MRALLQRVTQAGVTVKGEKIASISAGLLVFAGVDRDDERADATRLAERIAGYRIFADDGGRMNRSVSDIGGEILLVSQFTLAADTRKGMRPGFGRAAEPGVAEALFEHLRSELQTRVPAVRCGRFGADMAVDLVNDGPVTFLLESRQV